MNTQKTEKATDVYTLLANVVHFNVNGVATHYTDKIWVDDENDPEGGCYQLVEKRYKTPRVKIDFLAKVDINLQVGCVCSDGLNNFIATAKNEIRNYEDCVEVFKVPKKVVCVYMVANCKINTKCQLKNTAHLSKSGQRIEVLSNRQSKGGLRSTLSS